MRDFYEILGVAKDAEPAAIRKSFKKLAREFHPDLNKDPKAADRFKEINAAYEVLGDEEKRALYDEFGEDSLRPGFNADQARAFRQSYGAYPRGGDGMGGGFSFEELFGSLFAQGGIGGRGGGRQESRRGAAHGTDLESQLAISVADAIRGTTEHLTVRRPGRCAACNGEGGTGKRTCAHCGGMGRLRMGGGPFQNIALPCDDCGGSGSVFAQECAVCAGTGRTMVEERLKVTIPPGVREGQVIRLRGKGGEGIRGGEPGDLLLKILLRPQPGLTRDGNDLSLEVPITIYEALAGARIEVQTPDGNVRVTVPAGAGNGQKLRLRGKGAPGAHGRGDLYLVLRPEPPRTTDPEALRLAEALNAYYGGGVREGAQG